jgi:uncharacterized protein
MTLMSIFLLLVAVSAASFLAFHCFVHRSLAPERLAEGTSPASLGLSYAEVGIPTANGKQLYGWLVPASKADKAPAVVIIHGWGGNAETMLPLVTPLHEAGFTALLIDARCHGRSDGDTFASLPRFAEDMECAMIWLKQQAAVEPDGIALVGHSVGAGAALLVASRRNDVSAVVSLAAFSHPAAIMRRFLAAKHIPYLPIGWAILSYVQHAIGYRFDDIAPAATIRTVRCPTLLVHGADDATVPVAEAHAIYAARGGEHVQLRVIAGSHDDFGDANDVADEVAAMVAFLSGNTSRSTQHSERMFATATE